MNDRFGREIFYLRVAVTDRCNFRCIYCMPSEEVSWRPPAEVLTGEEIVRLVRIAVELGVRKVRLTGGEPLGREDIVELVEALARLPGLGELTLTTNGALLPRYAEDLRRVGLRRVNISLDTLRPERFQRITRLGRLEDTLAGIAAAKEVGFSPVKLNVVVMRGINDDEVVDLAEKAREGFHVRFIEWIPLGRAEGDWHDRFVPGAEIKARIEKELGPLIPLREEGSAKVFQIPGAVGEIGLITGLSAPFCSSCNRLRLTAGGKLRLCLLWPLEVDVAGPLRAGATDAELRAIFMQAISGKPWAHRGPRALPRDQGMCALGG